MSRWVNQFSILLVLGILMDQWFKALANKYLSFFKPLWIIQKYLSMQLVHNYGAAYGILQHQRIFLLCVSGAVIVGCAIFYRKIAINIWTSYGLTFVMIGTIGNFIDRLFRGYVIDYMDMKIFPVFNLADVCIDIGIAWFILDMILQFRKEYLIKMGSHS